MGTVSRRCFLKCGVFGLAVVSGLSQIERLAAFAANPSDSEALNLDNDQRVSATLKGATTGLVFLGAYDQAMGAEFGEEKAAALQTEATQFVTKGHAQKIREETGMEDFDLEAAHSIVSKLVRENMGIVFQTIEKTPTRIMYSVGRCPVYDSSEMLGMDPAAIQVRCGPVAIEYIEALVQELNPDVQVQLHSFRQTADDICVESFGIS